MNNDLNRESKEHRHNFQKLGFAARKLWLMGFVHFFILIVFLAYLFVANVYVNNNGVFFNRTFSKDVIEKKCLFISGTSSNIQYNTVSSYNKLAPNQSAGSVNPIFFQNVPYLTANASVSLEYKATYIKILLPFIINVNNKVNKQREEIISIYNKSYYDTLEEEDIVKLKKLSEEYSVVISEESLWEYIKAINELLIRIDTIPNSLFVSLLAGMSNWGKSDIVKDNALFYQLKDKYISKKLPNVLKSSNFTHKKESKIEDSIAGFLSYVNTAKDFSSLRRARYSLKHSGKHGDSLVLLESVPTYILQSQNNIFKKIIVEQELKQYDNITTTVSGSKVCVKVY